MERTGRRDIHMQSTLAGAVRLRRNGETQQSEEVSKIVNPVVFASYSLFPSTTGRVTVKVVPIPS